MTPIVLASGSPRRRALLEALGFDIEVVVSDSPETMQGLPQEVVLENAARKCRDVATRLKHDALVIGADTIVVHAGRILGKPRDLAEAREMLESLSGYTHAVYTGIHIVDRAGEREVSGYEKTDVTFRPLSSEEIDVFVEAVRPLDRAGAYTVDGPGSLIVARYDGCYQNVLGLPIVRLDALFRELGDTLFDRIEPARAKFL